MRTHADRSQSKHPSRERRRAACVFALALLAAACTTPGAPRPARIEVLEGSGFTITEDVRVGVRARSDFQRAMRLLEEGDSEGGIDLLVKVTEAVPQATVAHIDLAIAYRQVDDLARAEASLERALELNPRHPVIHNELGLVYRRTGRFAEARESYERALSIYSGFHFARRNLAILCDLYLEDLECALENYELYTQAVPDDESVAMWVVDLRNRAGR